MHTQIIIDAEQSLTENVIKVNSIHRKYIGFEKEHTQNQQVLSDLQRVAQFN